MKKKLRSHLYFRTFRGKLLFAFLAIAMIPVAISAVGIMLFSSSALNRQAHASATGRLNSISDHLGSLLSSYEEFADDASHTIRTLDPSLNASDEQHAALAAELERAIREERNITGCGVYSIDGTLAYAVGVGTIPVERPLYWGILPEAASANGKTVYAGGDDENACVEVAKLLYDDVDDPAGYLVLGIPATTFESAAVFTSGEDSLIILDATGYPVYSTRKLSDGEIEAFRFALAVDGIPEWNESGNTITLPTVESTSGFYIIYEQNAPMTLAARSVILTVSLIVLAIGFLIGVVLSATVSRSLAEPIGELSDAMARVSAGDLNAFVPVTSHDEIGELSDSFNHMTAELDRHVKESVKRQQDLNDTQIRLLQTQLNPHFLYNTLDTIKWISKLHNVPEAASLAANLATVLRRSISNAPFISLSAELDMLRSYIDIQQIRFSDKFHYIVDVPEDLYTCQIPKLILQPLVENAILHGLENRDEGSVRVAASEENGVLTLTVSDDGAGMPKEHLDRINSPGGKMIQGHLGMYNVYQIIKLNYGDAYGMRAESEPDRGTTIILTLPVIREGDENIDQSRDR